MDMNILHAESRAKSKLPKRLIIAAGVLLMVALGMVIFSGDEKPDTPKTPDTGAPQTPAVAPPVTSPGTQVPAAKPPVAKPPVAKPVAVWGPTGMTAELAKRIGPSPITVKPVDKATAAKDFKDAMALYTARKDALRCRTLLNRAYQAGVMTGALTAADLTTCRKALLDMSARTVFNRSPYVNPADPYMLGHKWGPGERLNSTRKNGVVVRKGIIAQFDLCTPATIVPWYNGLSDATKFRAEAHYKLLRGPFHLVVYRSQFVADLYLQDLLVRRIPVALGKADTPTPTGFFRVPTWSGKSGKSTYYPPVSFGGATGPIYPGQPGYPLGPKGYNIKIEGMAELGTKIHASQGYAIHGTSEPASLGSAASHGCIRVGAADMDLLYKTMMDYADPRDPKVNWPHFSTITVRK